MNESTVSQFTATGTNEVPYESNLVTLYISYVYMIYMPLHNLAGNHAQTNVISYLQKYIH